MRHLAARPYAPLRWYSRHVNRPLIAVFERLSRRRWLVALLVAVEIASVVAATIFIR